MWLDLIPNDPHQRVLCQVRGCDHQATILRAELIWDNMRFRCIAMCQPHALASEDKSKPLLQLGPICIVEREEAEIN